MPVLSGEPAVIVGAVLAALNVVQVAAIPMPTWAHALIVAVSTGLAALVTRQKVTPVGKIGPSEIPPAIMLAPHEQFRPGQPMVEAQAQQLAAGPRAAAHRTGFDFAWGAPSPPSVKAAGGSFVIGYISHDLSKDLTASEVRWYNGQGLDVAVVFETTAGRALEGYNAGVADAEFALQRMRDLGAPWWVCVYYAVDVDETPEEAPAVASYFRGIRDAHRRHGWKWRGKVKVPLLRHRVGAYGGYWTVSRLWALKLIDRIWQTFAWSGGMWHAHAVLQQRRNGIYVGGVQCDEDWGVGSAFGQWRRGQRPKPGPAPKPRPPAKPPAYPGLLREGMHSTNVRWVQKALNTQDNASLVEDGIYGPRTKDAVANFQRRHHLAVDGIVGPHTWAALFPKGANK